MDKKWLIRTKNQHILGPISKEKVKELLENASIKGDDEICSGNGYWFYIRESELVKKFVYGDEEQPFHPVSEAVEQHSSTNERSIQLKGEELEEEIKIPSEEDLEYPEV